MYTTDIVQFLNNWFSKFACSLCKRVMPTDIKVFSEAYIALASRKHLFAHRHRYNRRAFRTTQLGVHVYRDVRYIVTWPVLSKLTNQQYEIR